jgi:hypothetical protein
MSGAVPPLTQYAFMAWCSVRGSTGTTLPLTLYVMFCMGVKLGLSPWVRNIYWENLWAGCWGEYWNIKGRRILEYKREEGARDRRKLHNDELVIFTLHQIPTGEQLWEDHMGDVWSTQVREKTHTNSWSEKLRGRDHSEDRCIDGNITVGWIFGKKGWMLLTWFI